MVTKGPGVRHSIVRRLEEFDIESLLTLRREALVVEPSAFSASSGADVGADPGFVREAMRHPAVQGFFGAFDGDLVGMVGVHRHEREKEAHKAGVWGMYVRPAHRGKGLGMALLSAAVEYARSLPGLTHLHLSVSETAVPALRLYERMGFVTWGTEPAALQVGGVFIATHHMVLRLADTAA
jgi:GNAT superfamily N-acetyltransferase